MSNFFKELWYDTNITNVPNRVLDVARVNVPDGFSIYVAGSIEVPINVEGETITVIMREYNDLLNQVRLGDGGPTLAELLRNRVYELKMSPDIGRRSLVAKIPNSADFWALVRRA